MFLDYDQRLNLSDLLQDAINRNPEMKPIKKDSRISLKDTQIGNLTNRITFISKAIQRLTKLQIIYFANSPLPMIILLSIGKMPTRIMPNSMKMKN